MNNKLRYPIVLSVSVLAAGCAGWGKDGRIGKNDGSDPCYVHLNRVDDVAIHYNDDKTKTVAGGALLGAAAGAGIAALAGGDTTAILASAAAGAVVGGVGASLYWDNKLKEAFNDRNRAIDLVSNDLRAEVGRLDQIDQGIATLVRCRTEMRDKIRKDYASKAITREQAQEQWNKLAALTSKDAKEMAYVDDALNNLAKLDQAYQFASSAIDTPEQVDNATLAARKREVAEERRAQARDLEANSRMEIKEISRQKLSSQEKSQRLAAAKAKQRQKQAELDKRYKTKAAMVEKKINPKSESVKTLVSATQEKRESIKKNKSQVASLAAETSNKTGFEQIESRLWPGSTRLAAQPAAPDRSGLSCAMARPETAAGT
jgi:hypothetical protein